MSELTIGFAGMSHLGLVSAVAAASRGHRVIGFDADARLCTGLSAGILPVHEPDLPELLARHRDQLEFTSAAESLSRCQVVFVAIDVPTDAQDRSDLTPVTALLERVAAQVAPGTAIVVLSQVNPGYTRAARARIEAGGAQLYYQVETLIFGRAVHQAVHPERFIVGCADPARPLAAAFQTFLESFGCPVLPMRYESAELCKISINMFLVTQVSTTNMLAEICEHIGAEWREIAPALRLDRRIGQHAYLGAGLGVGGGNLQRDMATIIAMATEHGADAGLIDAWRAHSQYRRDWALRVLHREVVAAQAAPSVGLWGLSYKEDTQSTRNSPAMHLLGSLAPFDVTCYDPAAVAAPDALGNARRVDSALAACAGRDVLMIMTPWPEFAAIPSGEVAAAMRGRVLIDPFGVIKPPDAAAAGLQQFRLGTGALAAC